MSPIPLGIWATAGASAAAAGAFDLIETSLISTNTASVTFSSLPADYAHLQIRWTARTNRADYQDTMAIRLNGVTTATYGAHNLKTDGTNVSSASSTNSTSISQSQLFDMFATNETSGAFGVGIIDIVDFKNTSKTKTVKLFSGVAGGTQAKFIALSGGFNTATGALTSITLLSRNSGSFVSGSRFSIYGIKGA